MSRMIPLKIADMAVAACNEEIAKHLLEIGRLQGRVIALEAQLESEKAAHKALRSLSFTTAVPSEDYEKLKAELAKSEEHNAALCERLQDLNGEVHTASCVNANAHKEINILKAEVAKLKDMTLSMMSEAFTNARYESTVELPEGWNTGIARACELLGEKEKEITELRKAANGIPRLYSTIEFAGQTYVIAMVGAYDAKLKEEEHIPCVDVKLSLVLKDVFDAAKEGKQP